MERGLPVFMLRSDTSTLSSSMVRHKCQIAHCVLYGAEFVTFAFAMSDFEATVAGINVSRIKLVPVLSSQNILMPW